MGFGSAVDMISVEVDRRAADTRERRRHGEADAGHGRRGEDPVESFGALPHLGDHRPVNTHHRDEPEPMRVDRVNLRDLSNLVQNPQFSEGRALAALYLVRDLLTQRGEFAS